MLLLTTARGADYVALLKRMRASFESQYGDFAQNGSTARRKNRK
jgi:hypothetical protein